MSALSIRALSWMGQNGPGDGPGRTQRDKEPPGSCGGGHWEPLGRPSLPRNAPSMRDVALGSRDVLRVIPRGSFGVGAGFHTDFIGNIFSFIGNLCFTYIHGVYLYCGGREGVNGDLLGWCPKNGSGREPKELQRHLWGRGEPWIWGRGTMRAELCQSWTSWAKAAKPQGLNLGSKPKELQEVGKHRIPAGLGCWGRDLMPRFWEGKEELSRG